MPDAVALDHLQPAVADHLQRLVGHDTPADRLATLNDGGASLPSELLD